MVTFTEFARRFGKLNKFVEKRGKQILKQDEKRIVDMQTGQHHSGLNRRDEQMQGGYSKGYGKRRKSKGLQTSFVDLHFTGKMHKGLKVLPVKGGVDVRSKEPYEYYVRGNFPRSFGLTKANAEIEAEYLVNKLAVDIKKFLVG